MASSHRRTPFRLSSQGKTGEIAQDLKTLRRAPPSFNFLHCKISAHRIDLLESRRVRRRHRYQNLEISTAHRCSPIAYAAGRSPLSRFDVALLEQALQIAVADGHAGRPAGRGSGPASALPATGCHLRATAWLSTRASMSSSELPLVQNARTQVVVAGGRAARPAGRGIQAGLFGVHQVREKIISTSIIRLGTNHTAFDQVFQLTHVAGQSCSSACGRVPSKSR